MNEIRNYELAKRFTEARTGAHVINHDIVRLNAAQIESVVVGNKLTVYYGDFECCVEATTNASANLETVFGEDISQFYSDGITATDAAHIHFHDVMWNKSTITNATNAGVAQFIGYKFTLELQWGDDLLAALDLENDSTAGAGWAFDGGWEHTPSDTAVLTIPVTGLVQGELYQVDITVTGRTAGAITGTFAATAGTAISANGTDSENLLATTVTLGEADLVITPGATFDGKITAVTIKPRV